MLRTEFTIPFSVEVSVAELFRGIFEIDGLVRYADEKLSIEYRMKELLSRGPKSKSLVVPLDTLREVEFKRTVAGGTIFLRPNRLSAFEDLPLAKEAQVALKVKRSYRKDAEAMVSHLQRAIHYRIAPGSTAGIPFRGRGTGLREIAGTLYLENEEYLVLDVKDALVGQLDTNHQLIKIAPSALEDVRFVRRGGRDRLYIRPKRRDLLNVMPGSHADELELRIHRRHRDEVDRLLYELSRLADRPPASEE